MVNIKTPYAYSELTRTSVNGQRLYKNPYGEPVPSVTTVLSATKPARDRKILADWKKRVGNEAAQQIVTEASKVGTQMHAMLESYVKNEEYVGNEETGKTLLQSRMMADIVIKNIDAELNEVWGAEVSLCYPDLYAGTADLLGMWKGKPTVMDFKQTNKPKKREWIGDYFLQGTAYALAHNELYGTDIKDVAIFMCSREGLWQLFEMKIGEFSEWELKWAKRLEEYYNIS